MARVTRSKKIDIAEDQTALAIQTPLPETPAKQPLAELPEGSNTMPSVQEDEVATEVKGLKAAYRTAIGLGKKGKKGRGRKIINQESSEASRESNNDETFASTNVKSATNKKDKGVLDKEEPLTSQLKDDDHAQASANRQCSEGSLGSLPRHLSRLTIEDLTEFVVDVNQRNKPIGRATRAMRQQLSKAEAADNTAENKTPLNAHDGNVPSFDVERVGKNISYPQCAPEALVESKSLIGEKHTKTTSHSPAKSGAKTLEEVELALEREKPAGAVDDDSFVEQIICRSPAKPVSRIEDSVEALDQLEEALEAIDKAASAECIVPTAKIVKENSKPGGSRDRKPAQPTKQPSNFQPSTMHVKPTQPRATVLQRSTSTSKLPPRYPYVTVAPHLAMEHMRKAEADKAKKPFAKRPISFLSPKEPIKSTKPPTLPAKFELSGEAITRKLKGQREARQAQRESSEDTVRSGPGPKFKSTKPLTKSTFELPGEAISRKKREAHEARLKVQEEEERKRRVFKAKPVRKSVAPNMVPRDTAASRARQSKIGLESMGSGSLSVAKRGSNVGAHRPSIAQITLANMSAPRSPGPTLERKASVMASGPSMSGLLMQRTVSSSEVHAQRQRAKEIYNRDNKLTEEIEREKREREAAAKRSREEAAERGRQASREWAEKMRAKRMAEGDKGMGIGYGPGGQMGLRG